MPRWKIATMLLVPLVSGGAASPAPLLVRHALSGTLATAIAARAVAACAARGAAVGAAVSDAAGDPRALVTADGVSALSVETALRKARAAAINGYPTSKLAEATTAAPNYAAALRTLHPDMLFLGGGLPIRLGDELVGAIGVGGGRDPQADEACAAEAIAHTPELAGGAPR